MVRLAPHHSSFRPIVSPKGSRAWLFIDGSPEPARCDAAFGLTCCLWCGVLVLAVVHLVGILLVSTLYLSTVER